MIGIILPFYNEEKIFEIFLNDLNDNLGQLNFDFKLIFIDDFSSDKTTDVIKNFIFYKNISFKIIRNFSNQGHQKSIKSGLQFLIKNFKEVKKIIVMDTDGEDNPANIKELLIQSDENSIVVAKRGTRKNNLYFIFFYNIYKILFNILIGKKLNYGNYSIISNNIASQLVRKNFVHYPSSLLKFKENIKKVKINRSKRIDSKSKVNFNFLIYHALFSIIEMSELFFLRILRLFIIIVIFIS